MALVLALTLNAQTTKKHEVQSGETLYSIARKNGTTVKQICQLNGIKETTVLQVGRRLRVR